MRIDFLGQPFHAERRIGALLEESLPRATKFWVLAAWAQVSGLRQIAPAVKLLRERAVSCELILGIDGGIATTEALQLALDTFGDVVVIHDVQGRTYHPKVFVVESPGEVVVSIGSSNLTEGGLYRNYEANAVVHLVPGVPSDDEFLQQVRSYRASLLRDGMPSRRLDAELISRLSADQRLIRSEAQRIQATVAENERIRGIAETIFGRQRLALPAAPSISETRRAPVVPGNVRPTKSTSTPARTVIEARWWKQLTMSDAVRKPEGSHQRNYVILGKAGFPIDQKTWFRQVFFRDATWRRESMRTGNIKEIAEVPFEVFVDGHGVGTYSIRLEHAVNRVANQNNAPTWLHWSSMMRMVRTTDFTGWFLELRRHTSGYSLSLMRTAPTDVS